MARWEACCQPVIRASYQTNQRFCSKNTSQPWQKGVSQHLVLREGEQKGGRWGVSVKRKCENNLVGLACRFVISTTSCFRFWCRSLSGQIVVSACPLTTELSILAALMVIFFYASIYHCNSISVFFLQPSASVRGYHSSKTAAISPSLGYNWTSGSSGGQGTWSGSYSTRAGLQQYISHHQHPPHHHPPSTSYTYCTTRTAVSNPFSLLLYENICLCFTFWNPLVAVSMKHVLPVCTQNILIYPPFLLSFLHRTSL